MTNDRMTKARASSLWLGHWDFRVPSRGVTLPRILRRIASRCHTRSEIMAMMHLLGLVLLLPACGCRLDPIWLMDYTETVMSPEMRIEATNANGTVVIVAG